MSAFDYIPNSKSLSALSTPFMAELQSGPGSSVFSFISLIKRPTINFRFLSSTRPSNILSNILPASSISVINLSPLHIDHCLDIKVDLGGRGLKEFRKRTKDRKWGEEAKFKGMKEGAI